MTESKNQAQTLFLNALEISEAEERAAYLDQQCGANEELRKEVDELLDHAVRLGNFLNPGDDETNPTTEAAPTLIGTHIGPYKLREQLGEGGMGVVYVAEQTEPVRRKVALKIIRPGMASRDVIARFEAERQALAMMDHPNIAKVFDAGTTESGQPYFVMELVQGPLITEYCDQERLTTKARLELFQKVCRAVHHAHQKGIIHRDLKPSNMLVPRIDGSAVPKVIDFGVAKAIGEKLTEKTVYTQFSQLVGTPLYMSPEQAELGVVDIDTRSDVYSLGVLLYELLTGSTPFDSESMKQVGFDEMRRMIREDEPPKPSARISTLAAQDLSTVAQQRGSDPRQLSGSLKDELDWLVMKTLEKDRNRRYESASALAEDVESFLCGQPVTACPPSAVYRLQKFAIRNRFAITTAGIVSAALLLGIAGTSWQAWRATSALDTAETNLLLADQQRERALKYFRRARDTVDQYLTKVDENQLLQNPEMHPLREELVHLARAYYQQFISDHGDDSALRTDLATAHFRVGEIASQLGHRDEAREAYQKAVEIRVQLAAANPENEEIRHDLAETYLNLADSYRRMDFGDSMEYLRKAIVIAEPLVKPAHRHTLGKANLKLGNELFGFWHPTGDSLAAARQAETVFTQLVETHPDVLEYQEGLSEAYHLLVLHLNTMRRPNRAEANSYHGRSLSMLRGLAEKNPANPKYQRELARRTADVGEIQKAIDLDKRLAEESPATVSLQEALAEDYEGLAGVQKRTGKLVESLASLQAAIDIAHQLAEKYPKNRHYRADVARYLQNLGRAQHEAGKLDEAIGSQQRAIAIFQGMKPYLKGHLGDAYHDLSKAQEDAGNIDAAIVAVQNALQITREILADDDPYSHFNTVAAFQYLQLGALQRKSGKLQEALATCQAALEHPKQAFVDGQLSDAPLWQLQSLHGALKECHRDIARCLEALARNVEAASAYRSAIAAETQTVRDVPQSKLHQSPNPLYDAFTAAVRKSGSSGDVETLLREELSTWRELQEISEHQESCRIRVLELQLRLADWLVQSSRNQEAEQYNREAIAVLERLVKDEEHIVATLATCVHVCPPLQGAFREGSQEQARFLESINRHLGRALDLARSAAKNAPTDLEHWDAWNELARAYYRPRLWKGADAEAKAAIELAPVDPRKLLKLAPLLLLSGSMDEYQDLCSRLLDRAEEWRGDALQDALIISLLDPQPANAAALLNLAGKMTGPRGEHLRSVAHYRAGNFEQAIGGLMRELESHRVDKPLTELHLAVAHQLAGHQEESRKLFDSATAKWNSVRETRDRIAFEVLRQEAEQLLGLYGGTATARDTAPLELEQHAKPEN